MKLPTPPTQAPRRGLPCTSGSFAIGVLRTARPLGDSALPRCRAPPRRDRGSPLGVDNSGFSRPRGSGRTSFMEHSSGSSEEQMSQGSDHASAPGGGQASRRMRAPCPISIIPKCVVPTVRPIRDCCLLATRPQDCSKSARLCDFYVCNPTLLRTGLPHAPDSRAKLQATRVQGATQRRASLPRGLPG